MRPVDLPTIDHYPHGTRARYVAGCRCSPCGQSNREYAKQRYRAQRRGEWNGLVDAGEAKEHLKRLSRQGIGLRSVQAATDIGRTTLMEIASGRQNQVRALLAKKILAVDSSARADKSLVKAGPTWKLLNQLLAEGYPKRRIAAFLGSKSKNPALQVQRDWVLAKTAQKVKKLHRFLLAEAKGDKSISEICTQCGFSHKKRDRQQYLRNLLPNKISVIKEALPCLYDGTTGERRLFRDLQTIGAKPSGTRNGLWERGDKHGRKTIRRETARNTHGDVGS